MADPTVTYAGVPFLLPDDRVLDRMQRYQPDLYDVLPWGTHAPGFASAAELGISPPTPPRLRVGDFYFPSGVGRFAVYRGLMTKASVERLAARVESTLTGSVNTSLLWLFVMDDGTGGRVTHGMFLLGPPRSLAVGLGADLYLVTLVDWRYLLSRMGGQSVGPLTATSGASQTSAAWSAALQPASFLHVNQPMIGNPTGIVGFPIEPTDLTAVESVYGTANLTAPAFSVWGPVGPRLDSLAASVGRVFVAQMGAAAGSDSLYASLPNFRLYTYANARIEAEKSRHLNRSLSSALTPTVWGGTDDLSYTTLAARFRRPLVPQVRVSFPVHVGTWESGDFDFGMDGSEGYRVKNPVSYLVPLSILGAPYNTWAAPSEAQYRHGVVDLFCHSPWTGETANAAANQALAERLARDYYDLTQGIVDECFPGVHPWQPDGLTDVVWSLTQDRDGPKAFTRAVSRPANAVPTVFANRVSSTRHPADPIFARITGWSGGSSGTDSGNGTYTATRVYRTGNAAPWADWSPATTYLNVRRAYSNTTAIGAQPWIQTGQVVHLLRDPYWVDQYLIISPGAMHARSFNLMDGAGNPVTLNIAARDLISSFTSAPVVPPSPPPPPPPPPPRIDPLAPMPLTLMVGQSVSVPAFDAAGGMPPYTYLTTSGGAGVSVSGATSRTPTLTGVTANNTAVSVTTTVADSDSPAVTDAAVTMVTVIPVVGWDVPAAPPVRRQYRYVSGAHYVIPLANLDVPPLEAWNRPTQAAARARKSVAAVAGGQSFGPTKEPNIA